MANIFQCESKVARCVREWDRLLREREWVDTDVFASIFSYATISGDDMLGYEKAIKKAKREIRTALAEQGMSLRESRSAEDNRKILSAYPEHSEDPLHNLRIMAIIDNAMRCSRALHLTYAPSYHESEEHIFHPQYLRVYNGRQYVYGVYENEEENKGLSFIALPVDRILIAELFKEVSYRRGKPADYEKMMRNVLGASPNFHNPEVHEVVLDTHDPKVHKLLLSKPLHHSIREIESCTPDHVGRLTLHVQITQELKNWILHYGTGVEVVSPTELRAQIAHVINIINDYYSK